ncbi:uncharacterized protein LOC116116437 [Pistacia vera]|uniref:uncharacterized protein LOC116116437 n=1 Tax=Pistacia vera TaxID=55513 RepID=UPI0012631589|nr:uncharacterized protein LOC116116437 [Pistacia vera]
MGLGDLSINQGKIRALSIEENLELERELASLNKPAVKTIRTIYGDIYDCVDQYKQPTLDHPLLKDHKIQTRPSFAQNSSNARASRPSGISSVHIGLDDECPSGTVPIRRTTKEELLRAKTSFRKLFPSFYQANADNIIKPKFAGIFAGRKQSTVYHGGAGYISICNPAVEPGQFSSSVIAIEGGPADSFSTIRVGWMVNIDLFKDSFTRLYTVWGQAAGGISHGCYNTYCSGFVQTDTTIALGMVLEPISVVGGTQYYISLEINQDKETGNWWLVYGENGKTIGYWPNSLFTYLKNGGEIIGWGGIVYTTTQNMPAMGNGDNGELYSCHFRQVAVKYEAGSGLNGSMDAPINVIKNKCYKAGDNSYKGLYWGYSFYFGGNGGDVNECSQKL